MKRRFDVIVGVDLTRESRAAVVATTVFPWPSATNVRGIVARRTSQTRGRPVYVQDAFDRAFRHTALTAQRILKRRWPKAEVRVVDLRPADAILGEARRRRAKAIVVGSRHRGWIARRLLGSVSAAILRRASCPVLVVRGRPRVFERIVIGVDGSPHARRAVEFARSLPGPHPGAVTVVRVVEPARLASSPFIPTEGRAMLAREARRLDALSEKHARSELRRHQTELRRSGWKVRSRITRAHAVQGLLSTAAKERAQLLVIGARGVGGVQRLLFGSVAERVLDRAPMSLLIVR